MYSAKFETKIKVADKKKIDAKLIDSGFGECRVDVEYQELKIPDLYKSEKGLIASVITEAGDYRLDIAVDDVIDDD